MTKNPSVSKLHASVASVAHSMIWKMGWKCYLLFKTIWNFLESHFKTRCYEGVMQLAQRQPQVGNTFEDDVSET